MNSIQLDGSLLLQFHEDLDLVLELCNDVIEIPAAIETVIQTFVEADFHYADIYPEKEDFIFYNPMHSFHLSQPTAEEDIAAAEQAVDQSYSALPTIPTNIYQSTCSPQDKQTILCRLTISSPVLLVFQQRSFLRQYQPVFGSVSTTLFANNRPVSVVFIFDPGGCRKASRFNPHPHNNNNNINNIQRVNIGLRISLVSSCASCLVII